jgi:DNA-binding XRE family transcriptional regulator
VSKSNSNSDSSLSSSEECSDDNEERIIELRAELETFKLEMAHELTVKEQCIVELRSELAVFLEEHYQMIEKFDDVDWEGVAKAQGISDEFKEIISGFSENFNSIFKRWRQKNTNL